MNHKLLQIPWLINYMFLSARPKEWTLKAAMPSETLLAHLASLSVMLVLFITFLGSILLDSWSLTLQCLWTKKHSQGSLTRNAISCNDRLTAISTSVKLFSYRHKEFVSGQDSALAASLEYSKTQWQLTFAWVYCTVLRVASISSSLFHGFISKGSVPWTQHLEPVWLLLCDCTVRGFAKCEGCISSSMQSVLPAAKKHGHEWNHVR